MGEHFHIPSERRHHPNKRSTLECATLLVSTARRKARHTSRNASIFPGMPRHGPALHRFATNAVASLNTSKTYTRKKAVPTSSQGHTAPPKDPIAAMDWTAHHCYSVTDAQNTPLECENPSAASPPSIPTPPMDVSEYPKHYQRQASSAHPRRSFVRHLALRSAWYSSDSQIPLPIRSNIPLHAFASTLRIVTHPPRTTPVKTLYTVMASEFPLASLLNSPPR